MAIIDFRSTSFLKAFILYSSVIAIATTLAIEFRITLENDKSRLFNLIADFTPETGINSLHKLFVTILITFVASIIIYHIMYLIFGWGGGMIVLKNKQYGKYMD
jgi:hypothetical protein